MDLTAFEHRLGWVVAEMDAIGFQVDVPYTTKLREELLEGEAAIRAEARRLGVGNINSAAQVATALADRGIVSDRRTPSGLPAIDKTFFAQHMDDELVRLVVDGKHRAKVRTTWVETFLENLDEAGRVHPSTNTLRARTARFAATGVPTQTVPKTAQLRGCLVADPRQVVVAADYDSQELRYLAAVSGDERMIEAFRNGEDLHMITAEAAFPGRGEEMRDYGKTTNYLNVYGGGAGRLNQSTGLALDTCRTLLRAFRQAYPGVQDLSRQLQAEARRTGGILTQTGRFLPVDKERAYCAINYYVQSGCRDITAQAILNLVDADLLNHMRLAIHDEIVFSLPPDFDLSVIKNAMEVEINGVSIPVSPKVGGRSWGSLCSA